jgi:hypothetical protein
VVIPRAPPKPVTPFISPVKPVPVESKIDIESSVEQEEPEEMEPSKSEFSRATPVVTGSLGRHFHFRYVEGDNEYEDEDK